MKTDKTKLKNVHKDLEHQFITIDGRIYDIVSDPFSVGDYLDGETQIVESYYLALDYSTYIYTEYRYVSQDHKSMIHNYTLSKIDNNYEDEYSVDEDYE